MSLLTETFTDEKVRIRQLMACIHGQALRLLDEWVGVASAAAALERGSPPVRKAVVSTFPVEGSVEGVITLRAEESAVRALMHKLIGEPGPDEDEETLLCETLAEALNIMIGNATEPLRQQGLPIKVFPPYAKGGGNQDSSFEHPAYQWRIDTMAGAMILIFSAEGR